MADGTRRRVEDVRVGDAVMGPDGCPRNVLSTARGAGELYRVDQKGGESYIVNEEHVLVLKRAASCWGRRRGLPRYPSYGPIAKIAAANFNRQSARWKANYRGYRSGPIEFPEKDLSIPPYVFGAWIGDGSADRQDITSMDEEIVAAFLAWGHSLGCTYDKRAKKDNKASTYIIIYAKGRGANNKGHRNKDGKNPAKEALKTLGVLGNKHIPAQYQTGSLSQRLEFLAGFIDTDGHYSNKSHYYHVVQKNEEIIRAVKYIADTCGFRTNLRLGKYALGEKSFDAWRLSISGAVERIPCRLQRKKATTTPNKDWLCGAISVEPVGVGDYAGFELDGDHLFLLGDCTVTHNSHFVAERMVAACFETRHRIACLREYQTAIRESSKRLIEDKIRQFNQQRWFEITEAEIRGPNDSLFVFKGLHGESVDSIKSLEGFTRGWVEEAQTISQRSLDILTPTFRSVPGGATPEMWFTWNPDIEADPIEKMFAGVDDDDDDYVCVTSTFRDNPWFPDDLRRQMLRDRRRDPEKYSHIWLGEYERRSERRVFHNWAVEEFETPADARFYFGADWGYSNDPTVLVRCWLQNRTLYVDYEAYALGCAIDNLPVLFLKVPESKKWRIRADSARPDTIEHVRRRGFNITPSIKGAGSVEDGIEFLKSFDIVVHPRCEHTIDELSTYSWKIDPHTDEVLPILEDKNNHVIDSLRYAVEDVRHRGRPLIMKPQQLHRLSAVAARNRFGADSRQRFVRTR